MADFRISVEKSSDGKILIYGNYLAGNEPIQISRLEVEQEWISGGKSRTIYNNFHYLQPGNHSEMLEQIDGSPDLKSVKATAYYIEIEEVAHSETLQW